MASRNKELTLKEVEIMLFWLLSKKQLQGFLSTSRPGGLFLLSGNGMMEAQGTELTWATPLLPQCCQAGCFLDKRDAWCV